MSWLEAGCVIAMAPPTIETGVGTIGPLWCETGGGVWSGGRGGWPKLAGPGRDFGSLGFMWLS
jgi:hypothetical protein